MKAVLTVSPVELQYSPFVKISEKSTRFLKYLGCHPSFKLNNIGDSKVLCLVQWATELSPLFNG